jgi:rare lipoprotein A
MRHTLRAQSARHALLAALALATALGLQCRPGLAQIADPAGGSSPGAELGAYNAGPFVEVGVASWYGGRRVRGRPTANGERFNEEALTAAHPTLPFDTRVRVTNVANGRSVVVRINDRNATYTGRVIDLSRRAAELLGIKNSGTAMVALDTVRPEDSVARTATTPPPAIWHRSQPDS